MPERFSDCQSQSSSIRDSRTAVGAVATRWDQFWCRPPFRDLLFCEPDLPPHLNKGALVVARRDPLLHSVEGTGQLPSA